jgi:hypothetical protein
MKQVTAGWMALLATGAAAPAAASQDTDAPAAAVDLRAIKAYSRKAIARCWKAICKAAKDANPACLIWLTSNNINHPHAVNSDMYKEAGSGFAFELVNRHQDGPAIHDVLHRRHGATSAAPPSPRIRPGPAIS